MADLSEISTDDLVEELNTRNEESLYDNGVRVDLVDLIDRLRAIRAADHAQDVGRMNVLARDLYRDVLGTAL